MDADRFDALTRSFSKGTTRRRLTRLLGGLALGTLLRPLAGAAEKGGNGKGNDGTVPEDPTDDDAQDDTAGTVTPAASGDDGKPAKPDTAEHETGKDEKKDPGGHDARTTGDQGKKGTHDTAGNRKGKDGGTEKDTDGKKGGDGKDRGTGTQGTGKQGKQDNDRTEARATRDRKQDNDGTKATEGKQTRTTRDDGKHDTERRVTIRATRDGTQDTAGTVTASATPNRCSRKGTCPFNQVCQDRQCVCPEGTRDCDGDGTCECGSGQVCQDGNCVTPTPPCNEADCLHGQICVNGACGCDTSVTCGYYCSCPANQGCTSIDGGPLQCACDAGLKVCDESGHCEDIGSAKHCADCYDACGSGQVCKDGLCVCPEWTKDCNNDGTCVPLGTDQNCADCNNTCTDGQVCAYRSRQCVTPAVCGNGTCEAGENCGNCAADCGECPPCTDNWECVSTPWCHPTSCVYWAEAPVAYGGACDAGCVEWTLDCGQGYCECQGGECVAVATEVCGDGWCLGSESCSSCPQDCGECPASCGDGVCNGSETCVTCETDCGPCPPGGTECTVYEDCVPAPGCHPSYCVPRAQAPVGGDLVCDGFCQPGTLDCGCGSCDCQDGYCVAVIFDPCYA